MLHLALFTIFAQVSTPDPTVVSNTPLKSKIIDIAGSPVKIDTCRAFTWVHTSGFIFNGAFVTLHNAGKKSIEVIGVTLAPRSALDDPAGDPKTSLLAVNLAPAETMGEDYKFTDTAKEPLAGGMGVVGKWQDWTEPYQVNCSIYRVRYSDGTVWP